MSGYFANIYLALLMSSSLLGEVYFGQLLYVRRLSNKM